MAVHPIVSEDLHQFKKLIFKLQKELVHSLRLARRTGGVHHHLSLGLIELAELERRAFIVCARAFSSKHILNHRCRLITGKRFIRQKSVFGLLDFLNKSFLTVRRHKSLAPALEHRQKRHRKEIRILAMQNPRRIFTCFQIITYFGNIFNKITPSSARPLGSIKTHKRAFWARILFQFAYRNIRLHFSLHHFSNQIFHHKKYTD